MNHHILLSQVWVFSCISQAIHTALLNEGGDAVVWVEYDGVTVADCDAICLCCNELISLLDEEADKAPAKLFSKGTPLNNISLLEEMLKALNTHNNTHCVQAFFFNHTTLTHYSTPLPLLDKEE